MLPAQVGEGLSKNTEREIVNHRKLLHPNIIRWAPNHVHGRACLHLGFQVAVPAGLPV